MASIYFCKALYEVCSKYHKQSHLFLLWQYKHNLLQLIIVSCSFLQFGLQLRHKWISNSGEKSEGHKMFLNTHNASLVLNVIAKTEMLPWMSWRHPFWFMLCLIFFGIVTLLLWLCLRFVLIETF